MRNLLSRAAAAVEPWYDWGRTSILRLDARSEAEEAEGPAAYVEAQWLGLHLGFTVGRTPPKVNACVIQRRQAVFDSRAEANRARQLRQEAWDIAFARYLYFRLESDDLPPDHPAGERMVDAYCIAMDRLICEVDAPDVGAVECKLALAQQRAASRDLVDYMDAIGRDLARFAADGL